VAKEWVATAQRGSEERDGLEVAGEGTAELEMKVVEGGGEFE
jgi:hypothetical protein